MKLWETPEVDVLEIEETMHGNQFTLRVDGEWTDGTNHGPTYGNS